MIADKGWQNVFGQKSTTLRFGQEIQVLNGKQFDGFVCILATTDDSIEKVESEMVASFGGPQHSLMGDGYAEYLWILSGEVGETREVIIDTMSNSLTYSSFKQRN